MREINDYTNSRGDELISQYINSLADKGRADHAKKIFEKIEHLNKFEFSLLIRDRMVKKLGNNLYELIIRWKEASYRIFFSIINQDYQLLHVFCKKSQKTPLKELKLATKRLKKIYKK